MKLHNLLYSICIIFLMLVMTPDVSAWTNNTFNNSLTSEFLSFPSANSVTRYLAVPQGTFVTFGSINLTYPATSSLGANLSLYYDFQSAQELVSGQFNLTAFQGTVAYNTSNCVIGSCGQYSVNNNNILPADNLTLLDFNGTYTFSFWSRITNANNAADVTLISRANNTGRIAVQNTTTWLWNGQTATGNILTSRTPVVNNSYKMITITRGSDGNVTIYVNGIIETSGMAGDTWNGTGTRRLFLGVQFDGAGDSAGQIDELAVFNSTLTPQNVLSLYNSGNGLTYSDLTGNTSLTFRVGSSPIQSISASNSTGAQNASTTITGLQSTINSYLGTCTFISGYCNVPFNFTASTGPVFILYNGLNFSDQDLILNSNIFNDSTYETSYETFTTNVTTNGISSAQFYWNGTVYSGSVSSSGSSSILSTAFDIPINRFNNRSWFWAVFYSDGRQINTSAMGQIVSPINLTGCTVAPFNGPYINFSFKNETASVQNIAASIASSSFNYWIGSGTVNKSFSYINSSEFPSYAFCFNPLNRTITSTLSISYMNTESPQRTASYQNLILNNGTTNKTLYLLPAILGAYTRYRTVTASGDTLSNVFATVSKTISGSSTLITSGYTDSSGLISFFLDPDDSYDYVFSKTGFGTNSFSLTPNSVETYTIVMGQGNIGISNGTQLSQNLSFLIQPTNLTLLNSTVYSFSLTVNSSRTISFTSLNITNSSGTQLGYISGTSTGTISVSVNTGNNTRLYGYAMIQAGAESVTATKIWTITNDFPGDYSLYRQAVLFNDLGFSPMVRIIFFTLILTAITIFISRTEFIDNTDDKILVIIMVVWAFSFVGWLDTGITVNATGSVGTLAALAGKYGIAIVTSAVGGALLLRRIFT